MIERIIIDKSSIIGKILFFEEVDLTQFENHAIPLFGPNGVGKSTLLEGIETRGRGLKYEGITVKCTPDIKTMMYSYRNGADNLKSCEPRSYELSFNPVYMLRRMNVQNMSEGQSIIYSMYDLLDGLSSSKNGIEIGDDEHCVIALDEIDSGLSIDNIDKTMRRIKHILSKRPNVQFIFSFNSPRVLRWFPEVLSMYDGTKIKLHTEDDMMDQIHQHQKMFDRVRKDSRGRPKVFE